MLKVKVFTSLFVLLTIIKMSRLCVFFVKCNHWSGHILRNIGPYSTIFAGKLSLFSLG